jgi:hypothetical protein
MTRKNSDGRIRLAIPHKVQLVDDHLLADTTAPSEWKEATPAAFRWFIRLDTSNPDEILRFAETWGIMGFCAEHALPASHSGKCEPHIVKTPSGEFYSEPLFLWEQAIRKMAAISRVGSDITRNETWLGKEKDWKTILGEAIVRGEEPWKDQPKGPWRNGKLARATLGWEVDHYLALANIGPQFSWNPNRRQWTLSYVTPRSEWQLFGWLTMRLIAEICNGHLIECPYCQNQYHAKRLPGDNHDHCCGEEKCRRAYFAAYRREQRRSAR